MSLINQSINELERELHHLGRPVAIDAGVGSLHLSLTFFFLVAQISFGSRLNSFFLFQTTFSFVCRLSYTPSWNSAVNLIGYLRSTLMEGKMYYLSLFPNFSNPYTIHGHDKGVVHNFRRPEPFVLSWHFTSTFVFY